MDKKTDQPPKIPSLDDVSDISKEELASLARAKSSEWVVYILRSVPRPMRTYAGVTNNVLKRIRQHNGEISGGACATKTTRPWELYAIVHDFGADKRRAMRFEWFTKVKHYESSLRKSVPGANGVCRRRFLVRRAMSMCKVGPQLHACMLAFEETAPTVQRLSVPDTDALVVVVPADCAKTIA